MPFEELLDQAIALCRQSAAQRRSGRPISPWDAGTPSLSTRNKQGKHMALLARWLTGCGRVSKSPGFAPVWYVCSSAYSS